jgi:hypothetical protein
LAYNYSWYWRESSGITCLGPASFFPSKGGKGFCQIFIRQEKEKKNISTELQGRAYARHHFDP